jgi:hypothetical protein
LRGGTGLPRDPSATACPRPSSRSRPSRPPVSGMNTLDRGCSRRAGALLDEAGWEVGADGLRRNAAGETLLTVEFLNNSAAFERIILPYVENLKHHRRRCLAEHDRLRPVRGAAGNLRLRHRLRAASSCRCRPPSSCGSSSPRKARMRPGHSTRGPRRSGRSTPHRGGHRRPRPRDAGHPGARARPRAARPGDLGAELVQGHPLDRLLGRLRSPGEKPPFDRGTDFWWWDAERPTSSAAPAPRSANRRVRGFILRQIPHRGA